MTDVLPAAAPSVSAAKPQAGRTDAGVAFRDVAVERDGRVALDALSLSLGERRIGLVGGNGSGKTTLLKLVNGLIMPTRGTVEVGGLSTAADIRAVRRRVGYVFQNPDHQIVFPIVIEDMVFGLKNIGVAKAERERRARAALDGLGIGHLAERAIHALSGGEKQLVALAAVLVMEPALVLFDEPTTLLDLKNRNLIARTIAGLPQRAIVASHDLDLLAGFDRVIVLEAGRVVFDGPPGPALRLYRERMA